MHQSLCLRTENRYHPSVKLIYDRNEYESMLTLAIIIVPSMIYYTDQIGYKGNTTTTVMNEVDIL